MIGFLTLSLIQMRFDALQQTHLENIETKGEIAHDEQQDHYSFDKVEFKQTINVFSGLRICAQEFDL